MKPRLAVMLAALWWGSLTGLGFVVVPMLFANLGSPMVAGAMAAKLFTAQTWLSIVCTMLLLMLSNQKNSAAPVVIAGIAIKLVVSGLFLAVLVEFGVSPRIVMARGTGGDLRLWHGLGSAMYLAQWVCATLALWYVSARTVALESSSEV